MKEPQTANHRYFMEIRERMKVYPLKDLCFCPTCSIGTWKPKPRECLENVAFWVEHNPQHIKVEGWLVSNEDILIKHAVVGDPKTGKLYDITPQDHDGPPHSMKFVPHIGPPDFSDLPTILNWAEFEPL